MSRVRVPSPAPFRCARPSSRRERVAQPSARPRPQAHAARWLGGPTEAQWVERHPFGRRMQSPPLHRLPGPGDHALPNPKDEDAREDGDASEHRDRKDDHRSRGRETACVGFKSRQALDDGRGCFSGRISERLAHATRSYSRSLPVALDLKPPHRRSSAFLCAAHHARQYSRSRWTRRAPPASDRRRYRLVARTGFRAEPLDGQLARKRRAFCPGR
jgi:hypothetical protein